MAFDKISYNNDYTRQNYDIIRATVPKGRGKVIKDLAKSKWISVSQLLVDALEGYYNLDLSKANEVTE